MLALLDQHEPSAPVAYQSGGTIEVPADWKSLPQSAVVWRHDGLSTREQHAVSNTLVSIAGNDGAFVGLALEDGQEQWRHPPPVARGRSQVVPLCDDLVLLANHHEFVAVRADTGAEVWTISNEPRTERPSSGNPIEVGGCGLAFRRVRDTRRLADMDGAADVIFVDARTGRERILGSCDGFCSVIEVRSSGALVNDRSSSRFLPRRGSPRTLPTDTQYLVGDDLAVLRGDETIYAMREGSAVWEMERPSRVYERHGDTLLGLWQDGIRRIDLATGQVLWTTAVDDGLTRVAQRASAVVVGDRLVLANRTSPDLVLIMAIANGEPIGLRIAPQDPVDLTAAGDFIVVAAHDETVVTRASMQCPSLRSAISIEQDLARSIGQLGQPYGRPPQATRSGYIPAHHYPSGRTAAEAWIARLNTARDGHANVLGNRLAELLDQSSPAQSSQLLPIVAREPNARARAAIESALGRTLTRSPSTPLALERAAAADAIQWSLAEPVVRTLAASTEYWLHHLMNELSYSIDIARGASGVRVTSAPGPTHCSARLGGRSKCSNGRTIRDWACSACAEQ